MNPESNNLFSRSNMHVCTIIALYTRSSLISAVGSHNRDAFMEIDAVKLCYTTCTVVAGKENIFILWWHGMIICIHSGFCYRYGHHLEGAGSVIQSNLSSEADLVSRSDFCGWFKTPKGLKTLQQVGQGRVSWQSWGRMYSWFLPPPSPTTTKTHIQILSGKTALSC